MIPKEMPAAGGILAILLLAGCAGHPTAPLTKVTANSTNQVPKEMASSILLLRGSRGFVSLEDYDRFVVGVLWVANAKRQKRLAQELASMRPLPVGRLAEYKEYAPVVSSQSLIRVKRCMYSVPSRLIGHTLRVELHEVQLKKPKRMSRSSVGGSLSFSAR